jgi:hypothetical protein
VSSDQQQPEGQLEPLGGGRWLRSSGYHIEHGMIRLAAGAELELYDPWEQWRTSSDEERPYKRLLRLAQQLHPPRRFAALPRRQERLLEEWVQRNGLLGILPHETLEASFAPRWVDERKRADESPSLAAVQRRLVRLEGQWQIERLRVAQERSDDPALEGELVSAELLDDSVCSLEVLRRDVRDGRLERRPLGQQFGGHFPEVPDSEAGSYAYAGFDTESFWRGYGESARQFVQVARYLADPLAALDRLQRKRLSQDDRELILRALGRISAIAAVVEPAAGLSASDEFIVGWQSPSLLGMQAYMLLSDLKAGHQVKRCPNCEAFFLAKNPRTRYCSATCRYAEQKRAWRKARGAGRTRAEAGEGDS